MQASEMAAVVSIKRVGFHVFTGHPVFGRLARGREKKSPVGLQRVGDGRVAAPSA
jgi:hypothetical protein